MGEDKMHKNYTYCNLCYNYLYITVFWNIYIVHQVVLYFNAYIYVCVNSRARWTLRQLRRNVKRNNASS